MVKLLFWVRVIGIGLVLGLGLGIERLNAIVCNSAPKTTRVPE